MFISYGRSDAMSFARRLADDLKTRGGHEVWIDLQGIETGGLFEVRIEEGIRSASVVVAVITRHALRERSICRDEVVFAINEGKPVVPLRLDPDPQLKPPLLLARRNWIDFTQEYEQSLATLLRYLAGDEGALQSPLLSRVAGVSPLDFGPEIARFSAGFTGRRWLNEQIDNWLSAMSRRALVIIGEPGIGKSAIAAWLPGERRDQVVAIHFCTHRNSRTLDPNEFVACMVGQLSAQLTGYASAIEARCPETRRSRAADAFRELIVEPVRSLPAPANPLLVVVDSLDEALGRDGESIVDVLVTQAEDLPAWLRVIATTRPEEGVLSRIRRLGALELKADRSENLQDVGEYVRARLSHRAAAGTPAHAEAAVRQLERLAEGNFLYARMAIDAIEEGSLSTSDLGRMTPGLADFYSAMFRRTFPDVDAYSRQHMPILGPLAVALAPVPFAMLVRAAGAPAEAVHRRMLPLKPCIRTTGQGPASEHALFHKSLRDWLMDRDAAGDYWCDERAAHACLARALLDDLKMSGTARSSEYVFRALSHHLYHGGALTELIEHIDERFLRHKLSRFGYGVLDDLEYLTRAMLDVGDPSLVERCVSLVEGLRQQAGGDLLEHARASLRAPRVQVPARHSEVVTPLLPRIPGLDLYVGMLPRGQAGADFFEVVAMGTQAVVALGDAPGSGLKSAFSARFAGNLLRQLVLELGPGKLPEIIAEVDRRISAHNFFEPIALTCASIDPQHGVASLVNAGQTYPMLYSDQRKTCDRLPVDGELLHGDKLGAPARSAWRQRWIELAPGDVLLLFTDGLTEDHQFVGDNYGHRFARLVPQHAGNGAKAIGEAILNDWRSHPRQGDYVDDVSVLVAMIS